MIHTIEIGRARLTVGPGHACKENHYQHDDAVRLANRIAEVTALLAKPLPRKPRITAGKMRSFPQFIEGTSTAEYVREYWRLNRSLFHGTYSSDTCMDLYVSLPDRASPLEDASYPIEEVIQ